MPDRVCAIMGRTTVFRSLAYAGLEPTASGETLLCVPWFYSLSS